ncbi:MAG: flagellar filament capping protein FliD [Armatimonadota bacterium]
MSGAMSVGGLVSGLNIDDIIAKLQQSATAPITNMQKQQAKLSYQYEDWNQANSLLLSIKTQADMLNKLGSQMTITATSSETSVGVSTDSTASPGSYKIKVNSLSSYAQITSAHTYTDENTTGLGNGTFSITSNGKTTDITVNNMTLDGLRDAINASDSGVKAAVISDGAATPSFRLVLSSQTLGTVGDISITTGLTGWDAGSIQHLATASDTSLTIGDAANGGTTFNVTRTGNTLTDVISGVTLALNADSVGKTASINISASTSGIKNAISSLVTQYNKYKDFVDAENQYDSDTGATGNLFGDYKLSSALGDLYGSITNPIANLPSSLNSLIQLGISTDSSGKLKMDITTLDNALKNNLQGVINLFSATGTAVDQELSFVSSTGDTKSSGAAGYSVNITQSATRALLSIGTQLPGLLAQDEILTVNGTAINLSKDATADDVVNAINVKATTTGVTASLTGAGGVGTGNYLTLTQNSYGSASRITLLSNIDAAAGGTGIGTTLITSWAAGAGNTSVIGMDVAGTINDLAATGAGQMLTGTDGDAKGLQVQVSGTKTGSYGSLIFTNGLGALISKQMNFLTDPANGSIKTTQDSLSTQMTALANQITSTNSEVTREMTRMRAQFNAMEVALSTLKNQAAQLSSQIAGLPTYSA